MKQKMTCFIKKIDFSWIFLFLSVAVFLICLSVRLSGQDLFILNHRIILAKSGSMEPYIMTHGAAITEKVTDIEQLQVGDVISFYVPTNNGGKIHVTHRIIEMEDGNIYTKGDNNDVVDGWVLTIDNVVDEVIIVLNQFPWLLAKWNSGINGKIVIIFSSLAIIFFYLALKMFIKSYREDKEKESCSDEISEEMKEVIIKEIDSKD